MKAIKFQVIYKGKIYEFEDGLKAYLFQVAVFNDFDKRYGNKALTDYISRAFSCIRKDCNETPIEDLSLFMVRHWKKAKDMDAYELLDYFYDQRS